MNHVYFLYTNILWNNGCMQTKNMNGKGVYLLIATEQGGTITIPDITQYDLLIFYMDIEGADTSIGATQQFTFVVSHVINRYGKLYYTGKGGNGDTSGYIIFNSATSFTVLRTGDVASVATVNAVYGVKL